MNRALDERPSSLRRFDTIRLQTECVYARGTRLWGSAEWPGGLEPAIAGFAELLHRLVSERPDVQPDGAVLEICDSAAGATVDALAATTAAVVRGLCSLDPAGGAAVPIDDVAWRFTFAGERFFVVTFAPCYGAGSSRHAFGLDAVYILFQTRASFVRRWAPGLDRLPDRVRDEIRRGFAQAGRPYDLQITLSPCEAHKFVKPGRIGAPPVRWWTEGGQR